MQRESHCWRNSPPITSLLQQPIRAHDAITQPVTLSEGGSRKSESLYITSVLHVVTEKCIYVSQSETSAIKPRPQTRPDHTSVFNLLCMFMHFIVAAQQAPPPPPQLAKSFRSLQMCCSRYHRNRGHVM